MYIFTIQIPEWYWSSHPTLCNKTDERPENLWHSVTARIQNKVCSLLDINVYKIHWVDNITGTPYNTVNATRQTAASKVTIALNAHLLFERLHYTVSCFYYPAHPVYIHQSDKKTKVLKRNIFGSAIKDSYCMLVTSACYYMEGHMERLGEK